MFGMSVFGELPVSALPILLNQRLRTRRSLSYSTVLIRESIISEATSSNNEAMFDRNIFDENIFDTDMLYNLQSLYSSTTGQTSAIYQQTIN